MTKQKASWTDQMERTCKNCKFNCGSEDFDIWICCSKQKIEKAFEFTGHRPVLEHLSVKPPKNCEFFEPKEA